MVQVAKLQYSSKHDGHSCFAQASASVQNEEGAAAWDIERVGNLKGRGEGLLVQHEGDQSPSTHMALQHKIASVIQHNRCHCCWQKGIGAGITSIRNGLLPLQTTSPD